MPHPGSASLPVHPTQPYEALGCLLIWQLLARFDARKRFAGQVALLGLLAYAALRSPIELVRADDRGLWLGVSTSQWLSFAIAATVAVCWGRWSRAARPEQP